MADTILKLKVESSEYDQKLKKAAEGIRHLADVAHKGGGELTGLEKAELDYIKALGSMETKSRSASGQARELANTYKELKVVYNQLNEVEKADEGGKALAASLETLKQRAQEAKAQLDTATNSLNDNGQSAKQSSGFLEGLASKFTINIDALKLFNIGLQAAEGALSVAKDAFFASEASVDEWGRVVDSSKSLYEGFLTALNTGDISGYLGRIDEIVTAARKAYDELDRLGTMKTIQAPKISAQQTENERMRMMIQTGRYIAPMDGRRNAVFNGKEMQNGQLLTPEQIRIVERQLQSGMKTVVTLVGNEVKQTGKAIDAVYNRQAQELGMSLKEFRKGTSSMAEFDKRMAGYEQYQKWREQHTTIDMKSGREIVARGNPFEQFAKWGTFRVDGERYNDLVRLILQRDQQAAQAYGMQSQAYRTMNRAEGFTVSKLMKGANGGKDTKTELTELQQNQQKINDLTQEYVKLGDESTEAARERQADIQKEIELLEKRNGLLGLRAEQAQGRFLVGAGDFQRDGLSNTPGTLLKPLDMNIPQGGFQLSDKLMGIVEKNIENSLPKIDKKEKEGPMDDIKKVVSGLNQVASGLQQMGIQLPEGVNQVLGVINGVMTIIQGISTIIGVTQFAAITANTVSLDLLTAAIWANTAASVIPFANGGIVGFAKGGLIGKAASGMLVGNHMSGDNLRLPVRGGGMIGINDGELILNKAQQGVIANALEGGNALQNLQLNAVISGEQIRLVLNNNGRRTGRGEYVQTNRR